jgi:hypothetical protein
MAEVEAFGDAITGGILARAIEPGAGEREGHSEEANCLNCGAPLLGHYCHECGQRAHVHRTLGGFFHDLVHGVFHFEGKIWRTLPLLAWKPGQLTRRYIDGQRARFISPIALFLFCVFLMFAVIGWAGAMNPTVGAKNVAQAEQGQAAELAKLQKQRADAAAHGHSTGLLDDQIRDGEEQLKTLRSLHSEGVQNIIQRKPLLRSDLPWLSGAVKKAAENPELLFFKLKTNAYKFSWGLIPISVPFVWLLFPFSRQFKLYDHTVFVTYSLSFMMLLLSFGTVVALISNSIANVFWFVPPIHMYRQLRGTYAVSAWGAVWRTVVLTLFAFIAITLFASVLVMVGVLD